MKHMPSEGSSEVTIELLAPEQFEVAARWLANPEINRWLNSEWRRPDVKSSMVAIMVRNQRNRVYAIHYDGAPTGLVGLSDIDTVDRTAMIWYLIGLVGSSGAGVATRAVQ